MFTLTIQSLNQLHYVKLLTFMQRFLYMSHIIGDIFFV